MYIRGSDKNKLLAQGNLTKCMLITFLDALACIPSRENSTTDTPSHALLNAGI